MTSQGWVFNIQKRTLLMGGYQAAFSSSPTITTPSTKTRGHGI